MTVISESGLYHSILGSKKPEAKAFRRWVTSEVLPAIRKTGAYSKPHYTMPEKKFQHESISEVIALLYGIDARLESLENSRVPAIEAPVVEKKHLRPHQSKCSVTLRHRDGTEIDFPSMRSALRYLRFNPTGLTKRFAENMIINGWRFIFNKKESRYA